MDDEVLWLRHLMMQALIRRVSVELVALTAVGALCLLLMNGFSLGRLGVAAVVAQVIVAARVAVAATRGPLSIRAAAALISQGAPVRPTRPEPPLMHAASRDLVACDLYPAVSIAAEDSDDAVYDVLQTPRRTVTAVVDRAAGTVTLLSVFDDDRILVTGSHLFGPHSRLVLNPNFPETVLELLTSHLDALGELQWLGSEPVAAQPRVVTELIAVEREVVATLGPLLASLLVVAPSSAQRWRGYALGPSPRQLDLRRPLPEADEAEPDLAQQITQQRKAMGWERSVAPLPPAMTKPLPDIGPATMASVPAPESKTANDDATPLVGQA
ncbi:MAG: hypothetical protein AAF467_27625 [Actinomycetota bacterium]